MHKPVIKDGCMYFGASNGYLYFFNPRTGVQKWATDIDSQNLFGTSSKPIVDGDRIYLSNVASQNSGNNGSVLCLDLNGNIEWVTQVCGNSTRDYPQTSMILCNDTLCLKQSNDFYLLNKTSGTVEFQTSFENYLLSPVVDGNAIYAVGDMKVLVFS